MFQVERELHRAELLRERDRKIAEAELQERIKIESMQRQQQPQLLIKQRQMAVVSLNFRGSVHLVIKTLNFGIDLLSEFPDWLFLAEFDFFCLKFDCILV